jgi:hypothetical protein
LGPIFGSKKSQLAKDLIIKIVEMASIPSLTFLALRAARLRMSHESFPEHFAKPLRMYDRWAKMVEVLCSTARAKGGHVFGGAARDLCRSVVPKDFDICFYEYSSTASFIESLKTNTMLETVLWPFYRRMDYEKCHVARLTLRLVDQPSILINLDVVCNISQPGLDFDVNALGVEQNHFGEFTFFLLPDFRDVLALTPTVKHILSNQLIVMDSRGKPTLYHDDWQLCIRRESYHGTKMMKRMASMKARGWAILNKCCDNPRCILADDAHFAAYIAARERAMPRRECRQHIPVSFGEQLSKRQQIAEMMEASYDDDIWDSWTNIKELARSRRR